MLNPLDLETLLTTRRTIGAYLEQPVPNEHIDWALQLAVWAPNHRKTEPWRFYLLGPQSQALLIANTMAPLIAKKGPAAAEAKQKSWSKIPGWLAVTCLVTQDPLQQQEDEAACCCALQNFMLALWSRGIGSKWNTGDLTRIETYPEIVGYNPIHERSLGLVWFGYPEVTPAGQRTPASQFVTRRS